MARLLQMAVGCWAGALLIGSAAFQAAAFDCLLLDHLFPLRASDIVPPPQAAFANPVAPQVSAAPLFEHNVFDARHSLKGEDEPVTPMVTAPVDPLRAPRCDEVAVSIVSELRQTSESIAHLRGPGEDSGHGRGVGGRVGDFEVVHIGFNWWASSPAVWLQRGQELCQAVLFAPGADRLAAARPAEETPAEEEAAGSDKVEQFGATRLRVERSLLDDVLEHREQLLGRVRVLPVLRDGRTIGVRLLGVDPGSLLSRLGLRSGDRLETINDVQLSDTRSALQAYGQLRTADRLLVQLTRNGKRRTIDVEVI